MRVSRATHKSAAQVLSGTPELLCHPVREKTIYSSRPSTCGFEAAAPSGYRLLLLHPSPNATGLLNVHAEDKPVWEWFIVGGPVHRHDSNLSAAEVRIQWYGEPSRLRTSLAAVDGQDACSALLCPLRSSLLAVHPFITIWTNLFSSSHSARSSPLMLG